MIFPADVSVSDMNDEDGAGGSSKSNSITSEHSLQSTGISASSQGSSTNSLPKGGVAIPASGGAMANFSGHAHHPGGSHAHHTPTSFHRASIQSSGLSPSLSSKSKLSAHGGLRSGGQNLLSGAASSLQGAADGGLDSGTMDAKNFATIRTTSIVQRQQKEHLQEEMHDQMSGYKRLRRDHQAALARLEEQCRQEMEKHKQMLDREYEQLLTQFSRELERLQLKHQEELGKRLKNNINTEKKLIKEVSEQHIAERKSFENKMKAEYKLKKERYVRKC